MAVILHTSRAALAALVLAGCLSPQEIELSEPPFIPNAPPLIDLLQVEPSGAVVCVSALEEQPVEFRVSNVTDLNGLEGQSLYVRWFLDYSVDAPTPPFFQGSVWSQPDSDVYEAVSLSARDLPPGLSDGTHALELVISDGFADGKALPLQRAPRLARCRSNEDPDPCYAVSYKWPIVFRGSSACPPG